MDELLVALQTQRIHLLLEDVLDGLDVVVGDRLNLLHALDVGRREVAVEGAQRVELRVVNLRKLRQRKLAQRDEVLHLDADAVPDECLLRKIIGQFFRYITVAAVDGRNGSEFVEHGYLLFLGFSAMSFRASGPRGGGRRLRKPMHGRLYGGAGLRAAQPDFRHQIYDI